MEKIKITIYSLLVLVIGVNLLYGQDNQGSYYGGQQLTQAPAEVNAESTRGESSENKAPAYQQNNFTPPIPPSGQTDEYGYFNFNAYCSGFTGTQWIAVPNSPSYFNENFDGAIEMWVYPTSFPSTGTTLMSLGATSNKAFGWYVTSAGQFTFRIGNTEIVHSGTAIPLNQWSHVAVSWTGGPGTYTITFFVNGAQSGGTISNSGTWNIVTDSLRIGRDQSYTSSAFNGSIDEVRFWSVPRTLALVRDNRFIGIGDNFNANSGNSLTLSSNYTGLMASWNFNTGNNPTLEFITGHDGYLRGSLSQVYSPYLPYPVPYNFALLCPFGANDYVTVPDNTVFNLSAGGTAEAWVYPTGQTTTHMILSRGTTGFNFFWGVRQSITNKQAVDIGSGTQFQNSDGVTIPINQWSHVAITWVQSGSNYTVTFYVNGKQSGTPVTNATTWNSTSGTLRIGGWHGGTANNWNGYLDEVKIWNTVRNVTQIRQNMFAAGRGLLPNAALIGIWNFDGNLLNYSATTGIGGSFTTTGNNCKFSGFRNESVSGGLSNIFVAHATTVNRGGTPNPFPQGYIINAPGKPINDNSSTYDTINVPGSATLTAIDVLIAIRHTFCGDLSITLKAPNGQTRDLSSNNGGTGEDILTFFIDGFTPVTTAGFYPPWSSGAGPEVTIGTFNSTNIQGNWILQVADGAAGDTGNLIGWGLRFNNATTNIEPVSNIIPGTYVLYQNYPNPFNPVTSIKFDIPKSSNVKLVIYDILGREVRTLLNEFKNPGAYEMNFDASNIASGTYFYRIEAGDFVQVKKMVLVK